MIAVTGGLGFIGSAFVRMISADGLEVLNIDKDTYAGDERRLPAGLAVRTERLDVADERVIGALKAACPDVIVHFAAETHVTRSEVEAESFWRTNVEGTKRVLVAAKECGTSRVVHVSTDEVYGPCNGRPFKEEEKMPGEGRATSVYARSKAVADDLARSFSGGTSVIVARPTNCFGPWQHPEKAVARWTIRAINGRPLPVWGDGGQVRDWMFVEDACRGLETIMSRGSPGEVYNLGPEGVQTDNYEIARAIARLADHDPNAVYRTEYDRPQHDRRYAIDSGKVRALGWSPEVDLQEGLNQTVQWYREHKDWWEPLLDDAEPLYEDDARNRDEPS